MPTPEFVLALRKHVGQAQLWLPAATAVVLRDTPAGTEVLLVKRADNGEWSPVSGIVDPGEHPSQTAAREVAEEAGVIAEVEWLSWVAVTEVVTYPNGDQTQFLEHVFRCRWLAGEPRPLDGEATRTAFFGLDRLPPLLPRYRERIDSALADQQRTRIA